MSISFELRLCLQGYHRTSSDTIKAFVGKYLEHFSSRLAPDECDYLRNMVQLGWPFARCDIPTLLRWEVRYLLDIGDKVIVDCTRLGTVMKHYDEFSGSLSIKFVDFADSEHIEPVELNRVDSWDSLYMTYLRAAMFGKWDKGVNNK